MMTHTPGPWYVVRRTVTVSVHSQDGLYIVENVRKLPNQEANIRLIAAAPDLLEALMELESNCYAGALEIFEDHPSIAKAREAIKKATS
jgi:hypothetical protein